VTVIRRLLDRLATFLPSRSEADESVWGAIPARQYEGRHAESGGITREEQEDALEDVQEQASEMEPGE